MIKRFFLIFLAIVNAPNTFGQCLCGKLEIQKYVADLNFEEDKSNYELQFLEKPTWVPDLKRVLGRKAFSNNTLNLVVPTHQGINKLVIRLKNTITKSSMYLTLTNIIYDNDYFVEIEQYSSGKYLFDWKKINRCQSKNRTINIVDCEGMKFQQLELIEEKPILGNFNHNKIKVANLSSFKY
mgnify:CR=1 FL=1